MKKIVALGIVCLLCCISIPYASATEAYISEMTVEYSEFELYQAIIGHSDQELISLGYSQEEINAIRDFSYEDAFLERAQLSYDELLALGYTDEQICILKEYKGEPIQANSVILRAAAVCTGNMTLHSSSTSAMYYGYSWEWSLMPTNGHTDAVALSWVAVDPNAYFMSVTPTNKSGYVNYYSASTGNLNEQVPLSLSETAEFDGVRADFDVKRVVPEQPDGTIVDWAKQGVINVRLVPDGNNSINLIKTYGAVGHKIWDCDIGFSASVGSEGASYGFSFTPIDDVSTVGIASYYLYSNGDVDRRN